MRLQTCVSSLTFTKDSCSARRFLRSFPRISLEGKKPDIYLLTALISPKTCNKQNHAQRINTQRNLLHYTLYNNNHQEGIKHLEASCYGKIINLGTGNNSSASPHHPVVDYFPITEYFPVFYSFYTTACWNGTHQGKLVIINNGNASIICYLAT